MIIVGQHFAGAMQWSQPSVLTSRTDRDHEMLNTDNDDLDLDSFMGNLAEDAAKFAPGKREHFMHVMRALVDCYKSDAKHGIVLMRDGASESETMMLVAINSDSYQVDDMIDRLCNLRGMNSAVSAGVAVN